MMTIDSVTTWQISIDVPIHSLDFMQNALEPVVNALSVKINTEDCLIRAYTQKRPEHEKILSAVARAAAEANIQTPYVEIIVLPPTDWVTQSIRHLNPVKIGRFLIRGSHIKRCGNPSVIELEINAGNAFGTGHHATTQGCLLALTKLAYRRGPLNSLDLGCGAGTLAFAIAKLWKTRTVAIDIDENAIQATKENALTNGIQRLVCCEVCDGLNSPVVRTRGPYDLLVANILFRPLIKLARSITDNVSGGGTVILSGILDQQASALVTTYRNHGVTLNDRFSIDGWTTLIMKKPSKIQHTL